MDNPFIEKSLDLMSAGPTDPEAYRLNIQAVTVYALLAIAWELQQQREERNALPPRKIYPPQEGHDSAVDTVLKQWGNSE